MTFTEIRADEIIPGELLDLHRGSYAPSKVLAVRVEERSTNEDLIHITIETTAISNTVVRRASSLVRIAA